MSKISSRERKWQSCFNWSGPAKHWHVGDQLSTALEHLEERHRAVPANQRDGGVHLDHGQPPRAPAIASPSRVCAFSRACNASSSTWKVRRSTILGAPSLSLMKSVIVLSVSAWGAVSFLRSRSTSLSPVKCFVIVFSFHGVV